MTDLCGEMHYFFPLKVKERETKLSKTECFKNLSSNHFFSAS